MEARAAAIARRRARASWSGCSSIRPLYTAGTSAQAGRPDRGALSGPRDRPRRAVHLSRARPARGLSDARPEAPRAGRAPLRRDAGGMADPHARRPSTCAASGARTASASGSRGPTRAPGTRTRSPPSASGSSAGSACTASRSTSIRTCRTSPGSCPCGVADTRYGVTSLVDLGHPVTMPEVDMVLRREFEALFGATAEAAASPA